MTTFTAIDPRDAVMEPPPIPTFKANLHIEMTTELKSNLQKSYDEDNGCGDAES